jgi:hypothetical protein
MFETLKANIATALSSALPDHSELPFGIEIGRNRQGATIKGFAVNIQESVANDQLVGRTVLDVTIDVALSDRYTADRNSDTSQQTVSLQLASRCLEAFNHLATTKLNNSPGVRLISLRQISEPEFLDDEKTIIRTLTITANIKV